MPRISLVDERTDDPALSGMFEEIRSAFGRVPNLFRTYAAHPPVLQANWAIGSNGTVDCRHGGRDGAGGGAKGLSAGGARQLLRF